MLVFSVLLFTCATCYLVFMRTKFINYNHLQKCIEIHDSSMVNFNGHHNRTLSKQFCRSNPHAFRHRNNLPQILLKITHFNTVRVYLWQNCIFL